MMARVSGPGRHWYFILAHSASIVLSNPNQKSSSNMNISTKRNPTSMQPVSGGLKPRPATRSSSETLSQATAFVELDPAYLYHSDKIPDREFNDMVIWLRDTQLYHYWNNTSGYKKRPA